MVADEALAEDAQGTIVKSATSRSATKDATFDSQTTPATIASQDLASPSENVLDEDDDLPARVLNVKKVPH